MTSPCTIGIDIGGTWIKIGLVRKTRLLVQRALPTSPFSTPEALQEGLKEAIQPLLRSVKGSVSGVGVGVPGLVQYPGGIVRSCANLPGWKEVPLKVLLQRRFRLPVRVDNDVNLMTLAEWKVGAGRGVENLVCITLGTGVGGGLVVEGRLIRGWKGSAGEIGHLPLGEKGPGCPCGGIACLERTVGNREILRWVRRQLAGGAKSRIPELIHHHWDQLQPEVIDRACELGDRLALQTWRRAGEKVGLALVSVVNLLNPEKIVVGGGIAKAGRWLLEPMRQTVQRRAMRDVAHVSIVPAQLGASAGLIGAALLAQEKGETGE